MCLAIDNPASCEIRAIIRFLLVRNTRDAEIHSELCAVYSQSAMREGTVRQGSKLGKQILKMKSEVVGRL
jgi:hypothetical protein